MAEALPDAASGRPVGQAAGDETSVEDLLIFLPAQTAETLSTHLTPDDAATLRYLHCKSIPDNTLRAIASDLGYLEAWHLAATGQHLGWPAGEDVILKFIAHHLFDPAQQAQDPSHGMPETVGAQLEAVGKLQAAVPHAPSTVRRRLSHWKKLHIARDLKHAFDANPVRVAIKAAVKASDRLKTAKSKKPITRDVLEALIKTTEPARPMDLRDAAMLLLAFGSGGRRRAEVSGLRLEDITPDIPAAGEGAEDQTYAIALRRAKRVTTQDAETIYVAGKAARALEAWVHCMRRWNVDTAQGPIFRRIDRWSNIGALPVSEAMLNDMLKARLKLAGYDPADYSAHGLRSGFMTEARNQGVPLEEAMAHSKHKSYQVASQYYKAGDAKDSSALRILE
ncbi:MAG: tyrosine-type recombinase/integrase [Pseudomonadota bacterium]